MRHSPSPSPPRPRPATPGHAGARSLLAGHPASLAPRLTACATLLAVLTLAAPRAGAQSWDANDIAKAHLGIVDDVAADISRISINTPIWLAQHLPAMMAQSGLGPGVSLSSDAWGVSIGLIPLRIGVFNEFSQVANGMEVLDIGGFIPDVMPWPQFGATFGLGLGGGVEIGADVQFIPDLNVTVTEGIDITVGVISVATSLRWRINDASGPLPAFVIGVGGSYYRGLMDIGAGYRDTFKLSIDTDQGPAEVEGDYSFQGAPRMKWELYQVAPEIRIAWALGPFQPYLGFGFGITFGEVSGGSRLTADVRVKRIAGIEVTDDNEPLIERSDQYATKPAMFTMRPHVGFDIDLGLLVITLQVDAAIMNSQPMDTDLSEVKSSFDYTDSSLLLGSSSAGRTTSAALVATLAVRFQI